MGPPTPGRCRSRYGPVHAVDIVTMRLRCPSSGGLRVYYVHKIVQTRHTLCGHSKSLSDQVLLCLFLSINSTHTTGAPAAFCSRSPLFPSILGPLVGERQDGFEWCFREQAFPDCPLFGGESLTRLSV